MKNFRFSIFSILTVFTLSIFLTSCGKEDTLTFVESIEEQNTDSLEGDFILPPQGFEKSSEEEQVNYFQNLTEIQFDNLKENFRLKAFLNSINKLEAIDENFMEDDLMYLDLNLSQLLSSEEINRLNGYEYKEDKEIESRLCRGWSTRYSYYSPWNCYSPGWCCTWSVQRKLCWNGYRYRHINRCE